MKILLMVFSLALSFAATVVQAEQTNQLETFHSDKSVIQLNDNSPLTSAAATTTASGNFQGERWTIEICNECYTTYDFEYAASFMMFGKISVFNLNSGEIRSFQVNMGSTFPDVSLQPINTPFEALNAMQDYLALKSTLEALQNPFGAASNQAFGSGSVASSSIQERFGGICGPEGSTLATFIPDGIFASACFVHDECYASGSHSKGFCDDLFERALYDAVDSSTEDLNFFLKALARLALSDAVTIYHQAVVMSEVAYDAYCGSANEDKEFCEIGWLRSQWGLIAPGTPGGGSSGTVDYNFGGLELTYEYECYRTYVSGGGYTWVNEICVMKLVSL